MKTSSIIALIALTCSSLAPALAAGPALDKAVQAAAPDSKLGLADICLATYNAAKESPDEADKVLEAVLARRTDWKATQVYAIFRSVLLARPDLTGEISALVAKHAQAEKDGGKAAGVKSLVGAVTESQTVSPMLASLVSVVFNASLAPGVAEDALNMVVAAVAGVYGYSYETAHEQIGVNTNMEFIDMEIIPAPADMSKN